MLGMTEDFWYNTLSALNNHLVMYICSPRHMQRLEANLISSGISAEQLMNDASARISVEILHAFPTFCHVIAYVGKGNNGGDAVAVIRFLQREGWQVSIRSPYPLEQWSPLAQKQLAAMAPAPDILTEPPPHPLPSRTLLLDGILGLGAQGELRPSLSQICQELNHLRSSSPHCRTWSIDLPTGIDGDTGDPDISAVLADITSPIGTVKRGLICDTATAYVGKMIPIPMAGIHPTEHEGELNERSILAPLLPPRPYEYFKNQAGHVGIIAGSLGMPGAARLCSEAALRSGAGLVTLFVLREAHAILASTLPAEIMISPVSDYREIDSSPFSTLLIGPGLGTLNECNAQAIGKLLDTFTGTIILDADGLNLAASKDWHLRANVIATPHPGEMRRLLPHLPKETSRLQTALAFTQKHEACLILKGARSIITARNQPVYYNSTGGPAMATAGQGDVLAGVCAGLCSGLCTQGISLIEPACLASYLCGKSSDILLSQEQQTEQTLCASDTLHGLAQAILSL